MSKEKQRMIWWTLTWSFFIVFILRFIVTFVFYSISTLGVYQGDPLLLQVIENIVNYILWLLGLLSFIIWIPLGIVFLAKGYNKDHYNPAIKLDITDKQTEDIYKADFHLSVLSEEDKAKIMTHNYKKEMSPWLVIVLNIISFWIFGLFYYGFAHDHLPIIKKNDFWSLKSIWFSFIPLFNIYWRFVSRLKLINRLNLQYRIRNKKATLSKWLAITTIILSFIPYVNLIALFILRPIVLYKIQSAINWLVRMKN